jgi:hypothetical protein
MPQDHAVLSEHLNWRQQRGGAFRRCRQEQSYCWQDQQPRGQAAEEVVLVLVVEKKRLNT